MQTGMDNGQKNETSTRKSNRRSPKMKVAGILASGHVLQKSSVSEAAAGFALASFPLEPTHSAKRNPATHPHWYQNGNSKNIVSSLSLPPDQATIYL